MPYTVDGCFDVFRRECVDLDPEQTKTARKSRDFVLQNIEGLSQKGLLPQLYSGMSLNFGSFERKTKKQELDDIDMMVCFNGVGGSYHTVVENELYRVIFDKSIPVIKDCVEGDGSLNSRKVVNQLIGALNQVEHYKQAEKHRDHEAARLQLSSYPWNYDIVPCFYTAQQFYLIPDGQGNWKNTDPRIDRNRVAACDQKHFCLVTPLIRLMKYWKELKWGDAVSSYMFEQMVLDSIESDPMPLGMSWKTRVERVLRYLADAIKAPVRDPENLTTIGSGAFSSCDFKGSLKIPPEVKTIPSRAFYACHFGGQLILSHGVEIIEEYAFCTCDFKGELILPESLIKIGTQAFAGNSFSGRLVFPSGLKIISEYAFAYNARISGTIEIPENISYLSDGLFYLDENIEGVILHKYIDAIGRDAFYNCFYINTIICESANPPDIGTNAFSGVPKNNFTVQVPQSSISLYQTTPGWNDFKRFSAYKDFSINRHLFRTLNNSYERELIVRAPTGETWEVTSKPDWVTVSMMEGTGRQILSITIHELPQGSPDRNGEIVFTLNSTGFYVICSVEQYDYVYADGDVYTEQSATIGDGVNLVFMGDGYDAKDISEGKYLSDLEDAIEHFFNIEPYYSYKDYFNVHIVFGMSDDSGIGSVNTIKDTKFGAQYSLSGIAPENNICFTYACKAPINNDVSTSLITLVINTPDYGGMCYMWGDGSAIACCPVSADPYPYDFRGLVQHEAGGHGFGKLGDEYIYVNAFISSCVCPYPHLVQFNEMKNCGFYKNLSSTASFYDVPWSHLIFHPTYSNIVDIYEGGFYHSRGIFRSEPNSCMNNNIPYYSAISRQAIVERIMDYAGLPFDIDAFYANDVLDASLGTKTEIYPQTVPYYPIQTQYPPKYMGYKPVF